MKKYIYILAGYLIFNSCSSNQNNDNTEFKNDELAFIHSLELFKKAQLGYIEFTSKKQELLNNYKYKDNKDSMAGRFESFKKENSVIIEPYNDVFKESLKVSDKYLDFLDPVLSKQTPNLKTSYRNEFAATEKAIYEAGMDAIKNNYDDATISNATQIQKKADEAIQSFWKHIASIQNDIHEKHPDLENALTKILSD